MGRVINIESAGKDRTRMVKCVVLALRTLMRQGEPDAASMDLAAYISITLKDIYTTVEPSVAAWEKKDYWVKADRFRMEWEWTAKVGEQLRLALLDQNWGEIARHCVLIAQKFSKVDVPLRNRLGTPWIGAWAVLEKNR